jgi:aspartate dehydrogenase
MGASLKIGIVGLGAIGSVLASRLAKGEPRLALAGVCGRDPAKTQASLRAAGIAAPVLTLDALARASDVLVDCAPPATLREVAGAGFAAGKTVVTVNAAALLDHMDLIDAAERAGARLIVPSGAILALDAAAGAAMGTIERATIRTYKHPRGLKGAPYVEAHRIDLDAVAAPTAIFKGSVREGARGFPSNVNVAAAFALAGAGPDRTTMEVWADPSATRNIHEIDIEADVVRFSARIEGIPSPDNPRTGLMTPQSVLACLARLAAPLRVGT